MRGGLDTTGTDQQSRLPAGTSETVSALSVQLFPIFRNLQ